MLNGGKLMVRTILDAFCVKSGILCRRCEEKLQKGQVTRLDLKVIRRMVELEKGYPVLQDVTYHRSVEADDMMAVLVDKKDLPRLLGGGARIVKELGESFGKRVKLIGFGGDDRAFLEDLFSPLSILTINTVWIPDGSTETKVILTGRRPKNMPVNLEMVQSIAKDLKGMTLRIEFERE
jgi:transcription antitermination factor NusA-like protein